MSRIDVTKSFVVPGVPDSYPANDDACIVECLEPGETHWGVLPDVYPDQESARLVTDFHTQVHPDWHFRIRQAATAKILWRSYRRQPAEVQS